jgi:hypothetical protein
MRPDRACRFIAGTVTSKISNFFNGEFVFMRWIYVFIGCVAIVCCNEEDRSQQSSPDEFAIGEFSISYDSIGSVFANISWTKPDGGRGEIRYYVYLDDELILGEFPDSTCVIENLTPATSYSGRVVG